MNPHEFVRIAALVVVLAVSGVAQGSLDRPVGPPLRLVVNGHEIDGKLMRADGRVWVSVEDLARSLNGSLGYKEQIHLDIPLLREANEPVPALATGRIKGTVTFYFNANYGSKPDAGTRVILLPGKVQIADSDTLLGTPGGITVSSRPYKAIRKSLADGNGVFELSDIPPGEYTLVLESAHTSGGVGPDPVTQRDALGRVETRILEVVSGQTLDASHDFGMTAF